MRILIQLSIVCGVYWFSQLLESILPFSFPANVISLLLMLLLLLLGLIKERHIREVSAFFTGNMSLFLLPVTVSIIDYADLVWNNAAAFFTVCVVSMLLTFMVTTATVTWTQRLMNRRRKK